MSRSDYKTEVEKQKFLLHRRAKLTCQAIDNLVKKAIIKGDPQQMKNINQGLTSLQDLLMVLDMEIDGDIQRRKN